MYIAIKLTPAEANRMRRCLEDEAGREQKEADLSAQARAQKLWDLAGYIKLESARKLKEADPMKQKKQKIEQIDIKKILSGGDI